MLFITIIIMRVLCYVASPPRHQHKLLVLSSVQCFLCCLIIDFVKHYNFSVLSCVVGAGHDSVEQQALQPQASPGT